MNKYPRSIRYVLSTYSNNPKKRRTTSDTQWVNVQDNLISNTYNFPYFNKNNPPAILNALEFLFNLTVKYS